MTHHPRRHPSPLHHHAPNAPLCPPPSPPLHPSNHHYHLHKHPLTSSTGNVVKKPVILSLLKGPRIARQLVTRPTSSADPLTPRSRRANARPAAVKQGVQEGNAGEDLFMATAFLQFCATCERQIMIPSDSILYCSESCRRKDSSKPLEISRVTTEAMTFVSKHSPPASPSCSTPRPIVTQMTPTQPASRSTSPILMPVHIHGSTSELDPADGKPKIARQPTTHHPTSSEAFRYLSLFQKSEPLRNVTENSGNGTGYKPTHENNNNDNCNHSNNNNDNDSNDNDNDDTAIHLRPVPITHDSSTSVSTTGQCTLPSLAHSPTPSAASSLLDSPTEPAAFLPTNPHPPPHPPLLLPASATSQRPLPPVRHSTSGTRVNTRNFDIVMPYIMADPNDDVVPAVVAQHERRTTAGGYFHHQENLVQEKFSEHSSSVSGATLEPGHPGRGQ
ncbi:hypothetical protein AJ78_09005 [Emergomyces pasteurianus Ep9510]|uniref:Uncharacterized protein n=1 Tax=Emergomyces pasteurianus Ep9510 TaxID=1447872 RepID=A0A1J9Q387_9EURO|nr:hypothetical protein AJ78_09005 [Emergomyces pasteurianus Ep9510]